MRKAVILLLALVAAVLAARILSANERTVVYTGCETADGFFCDGYENLPPCDSLPADPSNLSADVVSSSRVDLEWSDNSASTPCAADRFGIYRNDVEIDMTIGPVTSYSDLTVSSGNTYSYKVRAYRGADASGFSNTVMVSVGGSEPVNVPGTRHAGNTVSVLLPPNVTTSISGLSGTVCLDGGGLVCTGPAGVSGATCNETTDECVCPADCGNADYGALMRGACVQVTNGQQFNSGGSGSVEFFVNGDCNPSNNTGSFNLTLDY